MSNSIAKFVRKAQTVSDFYKHEFKSLCSNFESDVEQWNKLYEKAHRELEAKIRQGLEEDALDTPRAPCILLDNDCELSAQFREERLLPAYCFARLKELSLDEITGDLARETIS
jgi:hypothetical protein